MYVTPCPCKVCGLPFLSSFCYITSNPTSNLPLNTHENMFHSVTLPLVLQHLLSTRHFAGPSANGEQWRGECAAHTSTYSQNVHTSGYISYQQFTTVNILERAATKPDCLLNHVAWELGSTACKMFGNYSTWQCLELLIAMHHPHPYQLQTRITFTSLSSFWLVQTDYVKPDKTSNVGQWRINRMTTQTHSHWNPNSTS